ncbi:hypothetical protein [Macrococcus animalis]|uniref:hypothetical protein n=1 Tax=Macrococcus animalis TaxID=3395467 RepID=UPI0039BE7AB2
MKEEFIFFKDNFFRTDAKVGLDRYKKQRWVVFIIMFPIIIFVLWYLWKSFGYSDAYYNMSEKEQLAYDLKDKINFTITFLVVLLLNNALNLPNEIHRSNMLNKNWKIRLWIIAIFFFIYIGVVIYFYLQKQPDNMQVAIFILIISNFIFIGNEYATIDEDTLEKVE